MDHASSPAAALHSVRTRIAAAAARAGRAPEDVTLIAVSKTHEAPAILPVIAAGQHVFGENRVQEAMRKWPPLRAAHPMVKLHLIGPLQTNKAREAVALFDAIHTIDRIKLARIIAEEMARQARTLALFIQVNIGAEPQKAGVSIEDAPGFFHQCRDELGLPITGLMCIPPADEDPAPFFESLRDIARTCGVSLLSMGMSGDYETAILHGATHVRVGSAIFGARV
ncbi:MAG: YggS family pyridoxal phosphate-dependent enzyme [Alphaproteobacteria bacterium]|nr:YggS family pyridoxal phosphate-dependent enzyme [Alphaproteobacteria bacterium]